ncbi:MAG: hypothetical protein ABIQ12_04310 [Opitutaceae bacterium]
MNPHDIVGNSGEGVENELIKDLREILRRERSYASFFAIAGDKQGTEVGVVSDWVVSRFEDGGSCFVTWEHLENPRDPPDLVLTDREGRRHGIEVTELVDGPTISAHATNTSDEFKEYDEPELHRLITKRVARKVNHKFKEGTYASRTLLIYSDEPSIAEGAGIDILSHLPKVQLSYFDEIWFVLPPAVSIGDTPAGNRNCRIYSLKEGSSEGVSCRKFTPPALPNPAGSSW